MFNMFPYTDFHELNLDWILHEIHKLHKDWDEFTALNTITFSGPWDITNQYPAWTIVNVNDTLGYISLQPVPAGIDIDNTDYWALLVNYTVFIADLQNRIVILEGQTAALDGRADTLEDLNGHIIGTDTEIDTNITDYVYSNTGKTVTTVGNVKLVNGRLDNVNLESANNPALYLEDVAEVSSVNMDVTGDIGIDAQNVTINAATVHDSVLKAPLYPVLANNADGTDFRIVNNHIESSGSDGIEINEPSGTLKGVIAAENYIEAPENLGDAIGIGVAKGVDVVVDANVVEQSGTGFHLEDDHKNVVVNGNVFHAATYGALVSNKSINSGEENYFILTDNMFEGPGSSIAGTYGIHIVHSADSEIVGANVNGNVIHDVSRGFYAPATTPLPTVSAAGMFIKDTDRPIITGGNITGAVAISNPSGIIITADHGIIDHVDILDPVTDVDKVYSSSANSPLTCIKHLRYAIEFTVPANGSTTANLLKLPKYINARAFIRSTINGSWSNPIAGAYVELDTDNGITLNKGTTSYGAIGETIAIDGTDTYLTVNIWSASGGKATVIIDIDGHLIF